MKNNYLRSLDFRCIEKTISSYVFNKWLLENSHIGNIETVLRSCEYLSIPTRHYNMTWYISGDDVFTCNDDIPDDVLKNGFQFIPDIIFHEKLFNAENKILYNRGTLQKESFMGGIHPTIMTQKQADDYIRNGFDAVINKRFNKLFSKLDTDSQTLFPIDYPYRDDIQVFASNILRSTLLVTKDGSDWIGGNIVGDRYIKEKYRGKGFGIEVVLIQARNPAIGIRSGTGLYSPAGYNTRLKAFDILMKDSQIS